MRIKAQNIECIDREMANLYQSSIMINGRNKLISFVIHRFGYRSSIIDHYKFRMEVWLGDNATYDELDAF